MNRGATAITSHAPAPARAISSASRRFSATTYEWPTVSSRRGAGMGGSLRRQRRFSRVERSGTESFRRASCEDRGHVGCGGCRPLCPSVGTGTATSDGRRPARRPGARPPSARWRTDSRKYGARPDRVPSIGMDRSASPGPARRAGPGRRPGPPPPRRRTRPARTAPTVVTTGTPLASAAISDARRLLAPSGYGWMHQVARPQGLGDGLGRQRTGRRHPVGPVRPAGDQLVARHRSPRAPSSSTRSVGPAVEQRPQRRPEQPDDRRPVGAEVADHGAPSREGEARRAPRPSGWVGRHVRGDRRPGDRPAAGAEPLAAAAPSRGSRRRPGCSRAAGPRPSRG